LRALSIDLDVDRNTAPQARGAGALTRYLAQPVKRRQ
jgi:hypothetical protein